MERENFFAISVFLRGIYAIAILFETLIGLSYYFVDNIRLWIVFRVIDIITLILLLISASGLRKIFPGKKFTAFFVLIFIGFVLSVLSNIATITVAFLNDPVFQDIYGWYTVDIPAHFVYIGVLLFCNLLYFVAWILFEKYMKHKERKKLARNSAFIHVSFLLIVIGMAIILTKDFLFYDDNPPYWDDLGQLFDIQSIAQVYDLIYIAGALLSVFGLSLSILACILFAFRFRTKPSIHTEEPLLPGHVATTAPLKKVRTKRSRRDTIQERSCPNCGFLIPHNLHQCENCGNSLD